MENKEVDKDSILYFMTQMTQQEAEERLGQVIRAKPYKFNRINYEKEGDKMKRRYQRMRDKDRCSLASILTNLVMELVEREIGDVPIAALEDDLYVDLENWIAEYDSEKHLLWKLENNEFGVEGKVNRRVEYE